MRTAIVPRTMTGLLVMASLSVACSSSDGGGDDMGSTVPDFGIPGSVPPGAVPGASPAPGAMTMIPGATPAPGGVTPTAPEGQGTPPLTAPGAPAPAPGGASPAPAAPVDGMQPPAPAVPGTPAPAGFFASGAWSGPVVATVRGPGTTIAPQSFADHVDGTPFCAAGIVALEPAFENDAGIAFTLSQAEGAAAPTAVVPTGNGIAVTFSRSTGAALRLELSGPDGVWCHEIGVVQGQAFIEYSQFSSTCWFSNDRGVPYNREPITVASFEVPGRAVQSLDYDFCVAGFTDATGIEQAPPVPEGFIEPQLAGTLSEKAGRAIVTGADGKKYVVSNNAWFEGVAENAQSIDYVNNSFSVTRQSAGGQGSQVLTFPYVSIGRNGGQGGNFAVTTSLNDNLPIQISQIQSAETRFVHNIGNGVQAGDFNATYDVWFAPNAPQGEYQSALGAFLMVWTHTPPGRQPIGQIVAQNVNLEGQSFTLWVGRRDEGLAATGLDGASPVVSYVANSTVNDYQFDLNVFIQDAVQRASSGGLRGLQFGSNLFLTDVFAGFEIWNGGQGLQLLDFSVDVQGG